MPQPSPDVCVLIVERAVGDAELLEHELRGTGLHSFWKVHSREGLIRALRAFGPHVVVTAHALADFTGHHVLSLVARERPATPVIVVTEALGDERVVEYLKAGAEDYVLRENLGRLGPAVLAAVAVREPLRRLSPRQCQVLERIVCGDSTADAARRLAISPKTIEVHRAEVMRRLEISGVAGLTRYAVRVGLVRPDGLPPESDDAASRAT